MKKIIALALSVLLAGTGYTIVDHTIEERVKNLESQVYSLNQEVSSFKNNEEHVTVSTNQRKPISFAENQKYKFEMVEITAKYSDGYTDHAIYSNDRYHELIGGYIDIEIKEFDLNISNLSFEVSDQSITTKADNNTITTIAGGFSSNIITIKINCSGQTEKEYSGKQVYFDLNYDDYNVETAYSTQIQDDGSFNYEGYYTFYYSSNKPIEIALIQPYIK